MCIEKDEAKTKIDHLIRVTNRLANAVVSLERHIDGKKSDSDTIIESRPITAKFGKYIIAKKGVPPGNPNGHPYRRILNLGGPR